MMRLMMLGTVLATLGVSVPAQAAIVDVTYTGLILDGTDATGIFGTTPGSTLSNTIVTVNYVFDTNLGVATTGPSPTDYLRSGGSSVGSLSPALTTTITIDGKSVQFTGDSYGTIGETSSATSSAQSHTSISNNGFYAFASITAATGALPPSLADPFHYAVQPGDAASGSFSVDPGTSGDFTPTLISESVISAVPLPAALPMFGFGVLILGGVGYARKRQNRTATGA